MTMSTKESVYDPCLWSLSPPCTGRNTTGAKLLFAGLMTFFAVLLLLLICGYIVRHQRQNRQNRGACSSSTVGMNVDATAAARLPP